MEGCGSVKVLNSQPQASFNAPPLPLLAMVGVTLRCSPDFPITVPHRCWSAEAASRHLTAYALVQLLRARMTELRSAAQSVAGGHELRASLAELRRAGIPMRHRAFFVSGRRWLQGNGDGVSGSWRALHKNGSNAACTLASSCSSRASEAWC